MTDGIDNGLDRPLWKSLTSTVGLIVTRNGGTHNVMAAEWTYFVAKSPPHVAVVLSTATLTQALVAPGEPFTVTLCSAEQAGAADFAGSFSGRDVDKSGSAALTLRPGRRVDVPWADGGVLAMECVGRRRVDFPGYHMVVGEVVQAHHPGEPRPPLVKHDGMYALGEPLRRTAVVTAAHWEKPGALLRLAASGPADAGEPYRVALRGPGGIVLDLGAFGPDEYGDLLVDVPVEVPGADGSPGQWTVVVARHGLTDGLGTVRT
jgi:flavin reductase (DIM6/NTAB) family NADH-FMN oxidoreductase RutF